MADAILEAEAASHGEVKGLIIPPPGVRAVLHKTAQYVARNGRSFEERILTSQQGSSQKFSFMKDGDPYHMYYQTKIQEYLDGVAEENDRKRKELEDERRRKAAEEEAQRKEQEAAASKTVARSRGVVNPIAAAAQNVPKTAPPAFQFLLPPTSSLSARDSDVIKLTARFTAVGGKAFLGDLASREQRNPLFDFLRPTNPFFTYFTALVDAYQRILEKPQALRKELLLRQDRQAVLERAVWRWHHETAADGARLEREREESAARESFANVDWHDFVVVETIDFAKDELLDAERPRPGAADSDGDMDMEDDDMDMGEDEDDDDDAAAGGGGGGARAADPSIKVIEDYTPERPAAAQGPAPQLVVDPITGMRVPLDQVSEHMRIQLIDPKWKEQKDKFQARQASSNMASGSAIVANLKKFVSHADGEDGAPAGDRKRPREDGAAAAAAPKRAHVASADATMSAAQFAEENRGTYGVRVSVPQNASWNTEENVLQVDVEARLTGAALKASITQLTGLPAASFTLRRADTGEDLAEDETLAAANVGPNAALAIALRRRR